MNDILQLKGRPFQHRGNNQVGGGSSLIAQTIVTSEHLKRIQKDLENVLQFWESDNLLTGMLVSVYYKRVLAKSKRVQKILSSGSGEAGSPNKTIVGAKFWKDGKTKHVMTHYVGAQQINSSIIFLKESIKILDKEFQGSITTEIFNAKTNNLIDKIVFSGNYTIPKTTFKQVIADVSSIEKIAVDLNSDLVLESKSIISFYETGEDILNILRRLNIQVSQDRLLDNHTVLLDENFIEILMQKAPYLIAMGTTDLSTLSPTDYQGTADNMMITIPEPENEPTIGVIDTLFDKRVYFGKWVEYHNMLNEDIPTDSEDYRHGTAVSSLIVDGHRLNPELDDGCGHFKVRHFGVATSKAFSSFTIIRMIKEIISSNRDIKVWNLSLGSTREINDNFISAEAAVLDEIQYQYDVIFVIAGTNKRPSEPTKKIGSPADSLNGIVVNAVNSNKQSTTYTRTGLVLSFFKKPDVSYYGGDSGQYIHVCEPLGKFPVSGTSFAAPWIARKLAYLIEIIGLNKELAKALILDAAIGWEPNQKMEDIVSIGQGIVPQRIEDILKAPEDEIKFLVTGDTEQYETFNYDFPVPIHENKYPYFVKATLCYFPSCSRNQGVDYTDTELDIKFGRIKDTPKGLVLKSIDNNTQAIEGGSAIFEEEARDQYRKWDNVKHIGEKINPRGRAKQILYSNRLWGLSVIAKERLHANGSQAVKFGVVITLKEKNGVNRIDNFIQQCALQGWIVDRINVENKVNIYETVQEDINFE